MLPINSQSHLDVTLLRQKNHARQHRKFETYDELLKKCHTRIYRSNEHSRDHLFYKVPKFQLGQPPISNYQGCLAYLIHNLRRDGLKVKFIQPDTLFIVWREGDNYSYKENEQKAIVKASKEQSSHDDTFGNESKDCQKTKGKEEKLREINRTVCRQVPDKSPDKTSSVYNEEALRRLRMLADRIKKK